MATEEKKEERAEEQARAQLDSIVEMVKRLQHCDDCDGGEDCELTDEEIAGGLNIYYEAGKTEITDDDKTSYHDQEDARQLIEEDPLEIEVRSDWHTPSDPDGKIPGEYFILLCTGGPACRIIGDLDEHAQPTSARLEYQDWFTPWIEYLKMSHEEREYLLSYAQVFYFGE